MNNKEITSFTSTFRPKCDQLIGSYDTKGNPNLAVTTLNVTILDDANWNIDPTFDTKKQSIRFRIKKLCEWDIDDFYQSIDDDTKKVMVGKQHHVNQQLKEREKLSTLMGINKPSKTSKLLDEQINKLAKHLGGTPADFEKARSILA